MSLPLFPGAGQALGGVPGTGVGKVGEGAGGFLTLGHASHQVLSALPITILRSSREPGSDSRDWSSDAKLVSALAQPPQVVSRIQVLSAAVRPTIRVGSVKLVLARVCLGPSISAFAICSAVREFPNVTSWPTVDAAWGTGLVKGTLRRR